ncbi:NADH:flavin oxidoreductase/NADH oxidase [Alkaliphilus metalliredigens QYMF]|uniref:NADH:flavin oxidoreductase/NADH oxidase n=1 Tax=Alkaliphilus metalliredigens (strain QYMF) TaxID=293826 RepID=A6TW41_ALKMQ|nr:NADH:flavin oxidoreductase/NADH oxidase [Alkaliphilus metalliredigens QYMF]
MSALFSPFTLKDLTLKNRIVMAPMCQYSASETGYANQWHQVHYVSRAVGGVGLILLEATAVEPRGRISQKDLGIWENGHVTGLKSIVTACKQYGARVGIQLAHAGRKCHIPSEKIVAPSAIAFNEEYATPTSLSQNEIQTIVQAFIHGAARALEAGFDVIEVHGAHGYLINEFLSPLTNHREDQYGGSPENRVRFLKEVLEGIQGVWPKNLPIILRVSAEDYIKEGNHPEDLAEMINLVKEYGIDMVNVSSGAVVPAKIKPYPGYQIPFSETIKKQTNLPTIAGGLITTATMAEEVLRNERADLVYLGRELLRNPYWPLHSAKEVRDDILWPLQYEMSKV